MTEHSVNLSVNRFGAVLALVKIADVTSALQPHQERVSDSAKEHNLLIAHGMGSGKSLSAISAVDKIGKPAEIFVPAPLVGNFQKEVQKHTGGNFVPYHVRSVNSAMLQNYQIEPGSTMVVDEAHLARNPRSQRAQYLKAQAQHAGRVVLLTGTPTYNQPENLAPLVNMLHGKNVLPENPTDFKNRFVDERQVKPGWLGWLLGVKPGIVKSLKNRDELVRALRGKVDIFEQTQGMPQRNEKDVTVEMSPKQQDLYDYIEGSMPWYLKWKVRMDLPPSKQEAQSLNAFSAGLRQVSNTPGPYVSGMSALQAGMKSPKMTTALQSIQDKMGKDPNFRGFIYSNYMDAGVSPMSALLGRAGIPHGVFHGGLDKQQRKDLIDAYNSGAIKVLLGTSAATEGLDLKGTKLIQVLEPHFNESKTEQAIARGIRFGSHKDLPEAERNVTVERYYSKPRQGFLSRLISGEQTGIDKYIRDRALEKEQLSDQIRQVIQEAQR
jgi:SNF2 family DNA or RNA helicase